MLPIEKGCLAIIVNSKAGNDGKVVAVLEYMADLSEIGDFWTIDRKLTGKRGVLYDFINEYKLMRIDGHKEETKQKAEVVR